MRVTFLGGLGEIGRNCAVVEQGGRLLLLDCGLMFPNEEMPGVDLVLPDLRWLVEQADRIEGCIVTHGHEDHMGALPYLLRDVPLRIYGSPLTLALASNRIEEAGLAAAADMHPVEDGMRCGVGPFDVELIPVTHSVPHGFAVAIHGPQGVILHTGDFKIDLTPLDGRRTDLARIGAIASQEGIRLLLSDSTNAEKEGFTESESLVGAALDRLFAEHPGERIVVACFASHLHRITEVVGAARATGRKVAFLGRSMERNARVAVELGLLRLDEREVAAIEQAGDVDPGRLCVLSTGSQGEPLSALSLLAAGEHKHLRIGPGDVVVLSSRPIPGNERAISHVIDGMTRRGATVVHSGVSFVHASGHGCRGELALMLSIANPEYFVPVHGEHHHLVAHARLAEGLGMDPGHVLVCTDGDVLRLDPGGIVRENRVAAGYLYVDGVVGDIGHGVLRDRKLLAEEGVVVVIVGIDASAGSVITGPEVVTRGWVHAPEAEDLLDEARARVGLAVEKACADGARDPEHIRRVMRKELGSFVAERTRRRPMIVPVVMEA